MNIPLRSLVHFFPILSRDHWHVAFNKSVIYAPWWNCLLNFHNSQSWAQFVEVKETPLYFYFIFLSPLLFRSRFVPISFPSHHFPKLLANTEVRLLELSIGLPGELGAAVGSNILEMAIESEQFSSFPNNLALCTKEKVVVESHVYG